MALPRKYRLEVKKDQRIFRSGRDLNSELFRIKTLPSRLGFNRLAIIVGSGVSKKAVLRNKVRRRIREIVGLNFQGLGPGYDIVIIAKPAILNKKYQEIKEALLALLLKVAGQAELRKIKQ